MAPFPPSTDLAQHIAQIRLAREVLGGHAPELAIAWLAPNNLVYALLGLLSLVLPPAAAARAGLWLIVLAWALATLALAVKRGRDPLVAVVASVLAFQGAVYWGFMNFLLGWPAFALWIHLTSTQAAKGRSAWRPLLGLMAVSLLLYGAHILWFVMGGVWLLVLGVLKRPPRRVWPLLLGSVVPALLLTAYWYPGFAQHRARFNTSAMWRADWWQRGNPIELFQTVMGGPAGPAPAAMGGAVVFWVLLALATRRGELRRQSDPVLLTGAALLGLVALVGPDKYMNTIYFAHRWAPAAAALLVLGLPVPRLRLRTAFGTGLVGAATLATSLAWLSFSTVEMTGFRAAVEASPAKASVLGLDFVGTSEFVGGRPFMQMMAHVQAEKGGTLNFSFAQHGSSLVSYRAPRVHTWNPSLDWRPEMVSLADVLAFDVVLVNGLPASHRAFQASAPVLPLTHAGRWRLYAVQRGTAAVGPSAAP